MANQLSHLLSYWHQRRQQQWVLGTLYKTQGSSYRKAGAMMLFSDTGEQLGLVSGGCLEAHLHLQARKVMDSGQAVLLTYDGNDEDDISFQLGIGCGGVVHLMLQPLTAANDFLHLPQLYQAVVNRRSGIFWQKIPQADEPEQACFELCSDSAPVKSPSQLVEKSDGWWLKTQIQPEPHLLVVGGGIDARPMVALASELGWQVTVWDPRPANARFEYFAKADRILRCDVQELAQYAEQTKVNAAVVMAHNTELDAQALKALHRVSMAYLGLLGPGHRREQVLAMAGVELSHIAPVFSGPVGLNLGGDLPESVALAVLAECHALLFGQSAQSLSQVL